MSKKALSGIRQGNLGKENMPSNFKQQKNQKNRENFLEERKFSFYKKGNNLSQNKPAQRLYLKMPISYRFIYGRQNQKGLIKNISLTGAFLKWNQDQKSFQSPPSFCLEDKVLLFFSVKGRMRRVKSSIVWINDIGCGMQFLPKNQRDIQIVDDLIYFKKFESKKKEELFRLIIEQILL